MSPEVSRRRPPKHLHFDALIQLARRRFGTIPDGRRAPTYSLTDTLTAGLALFALKDPSLLAFHRRPLDDNLRAVFGLQGIPSDSQMRAILDDVDPDHLRPLFNDILHALHRAKVLDRWRFQGSFLVALDGVEYFCSKKVHCPHCMTRHHADGSVSYYHQLLGAVLVHPDFSEVIPLPPEPIQRPDGANKNDCERNAARRWLERFRADHPKLPVVILEDALSSNGPHIRDLQAGRFQFLLGVKPTDHVHLFEQFGRRLEQGTYDSTNTVDPDTRVSRGNVFVENLSLNEANADVRVHVLQFLEIPPDGPEREWTWVTDLGLDASTVGPLTRAGRTRWRIENETFNTLKNQGYQFEHNFGHGDQNLSVVMAHLMMLAFSIDQVQQACNPLFAAAWAKAGPKTGLWDQVRHLFASFVVSSMREVYEAIASGFERPRLRGLINRRAGQDGADDTS
jgi:hypothetical protein